MSDSRRHEARWQKLELRARGQGRPFATHVSTLKLSTYIASLELCFAAQEMNWRKERRGASISSTFMRSFSCRHGTLMTVLKLVFKSSQARSSGNVFQSSASGAHSKENTVVVLPSFGLYDYACQKSGSTFEFHMVL